MLVAIVETGTGTAPVIVIATGTDVADAISNWTNSYSPPLSPANYLGLDTGWPGPGAVAPAPGEEWGIDRDTLTLVEVDVPIPHTLDGSETEVPGTGPQTVDLPLAATSRTPVIIEYDSTTPELTIGRAVASDKINGAAADLTGLQPGQYMSVPVAKGEWTVRALQTRAYDATVRADGSGDYTTIAAALDSGAKSVFITSGQYVETASLTLPEDVALIGESPGSVVIVLATGNSMTFSGAGRRITTGTITATNGSAAIVGVGTSFNSVQAQDFIKIGSAYHKVISVTDDLNLTLEVAYRGVTYSGDFVAQSMFTGATIQNLIIANCSTHGIVLDQAFHVAMQNTLIIACGSNATDSSLQIKNSSEVHAIGFVVENAGESGIVVDGCTLIRLETNAVKNSVTHGMEVLNSEDVSIDAAMCIQNGDCGIAVDANSVGIGLSEGIIKRNASHGVVAGPGCQVTGSRVYANGGDGIRVPAVANAMVDSNIIEANGGDGVNVLSGATDTMVTSNNLLGNTGTNFVDAGTGTTAANNKT